MSSFYDVPRNVPVPTSMNNFISNPTVPEVSMIFHNKPLTSIENCNAPFPNTWKHNFLENNRSKENVCVRPTHATDTSVLRKQVRFDNPESAQFEPIVSDLPKVVPTKTFEQMYMANIPNRHLDLSFVDTRALKEKVVESQQQQKPQEKVMHENLSPKSPSVPATYKEYKNKVNKKCSKNNEPSVDMYNYRRNDSADVHNVFPSAIVNYGNCSFPNRLEYHKSAQVNPNFNNETHIPSHKSDNAVQTTEIALHEKQIVADAPSRSDEPTVKDLLKIIQQQNEQLLILQKQVSCLIEKQEPTRQPEPTNVRQIEPNHPNPINLFGSTGHEIMSPKDFRKNPLPKFAIDVMTSFEVSIRPQQNLKGRRFHNDVNHEPKITEITETDASSDLKEQTKDVSLTLNEPLPVREECPSPENSIHVDMQDYSSDSSEEEPTSGGVNWTFYENVMGQVNNILKKAEKEIKVSDDKKDKTMRKVKEATIKHLKSIGVNLPTNATTQSESIRTNQTQDYSPTEVSFAVKQLLMKYLPDDYLMRVTTQKQETRNPSPDENVAAKRPDFSFATLEYMKKYNLISGRNGSPIRDADDKRRSDDGPKILDITALKQQPKLL